MTEASHIADRANPFAEGVSGGEYFVGREAELNVFRDNLESLKRGHPSHFYVAGLDGTGKSSYLYKLAEIAREASCIGACFTLDGGLDPYRQLCTILYQVIDEVQKQTSEKGKPTRRDLSADWDLGAQSKMFRTPRQNYVITADLRHDFGVLAEQLLISKRSGVVVCLDEGQRIEPAVLSAIKNALGTLGSFLIILSLRLLTDTRGAIVEGRQVLDDRAQAAEGDIGASGFYVAGIPMGPFSSNDEVRRLFSVRLANKAVQFTDDVVLRIGLICDRMPRKIVRFAYQVYDRAQTSQNSLVHTAHLNESFQSSWPEEMKQAVDFCSNLSTDLVDLVQALCSFDKPVTSSDLVKHTYPEHEAGIQALIGEATGHHLDRLCMGAGIVQRNDETYCVSNNVYRYALKVALGLAS